MATDKQYRETAYDQYAGSDDISFDAEDKVSRGEDQSGEIGAWVRAWVWIDRESVEELSAVES